MDSVELDRLLGSAHRVFVDSSTCISFHSRAESAHLAARALFSRIASTDDPLLAYMSVITVSEMLIRPIRMGGRDLSTVHEFVTSFPNLYMISVDLPVVLRAANIRALTRLALPDSLLIATALLSGCEAIITNDERWSRRLAPLYPQFRWIYLGG